MKRTARKARALIIAAVTSAAVSAVAGVSDAAAACSRPKAQTPDAELVGFRVHGTSCLRGRAVARTWERKLSTCVGAQGQG